jgi:putative chitinase
MKAFDILSERQDSPTMGLTIFDIDDTLFHTTAKIKVISNGQEVRTLTNQEFNNYKLQPGEEFDFGEFRSAEKFAKESEPIKPMINTLKRILDRAANTKVIMLTARADFDDKDKFLATFEKYGIDMSRVHVHRAGNLPGDEPPAYKKAIWVRKYLNTGKYNRVNLIDDSMSNLRVFKSLEKEYPQVDFDAYFVKPSGSVQTVSEGRRRKNKRRGSQSLFSRNTGGVWGAYGPGAFGGYGQDSGYSGGDGGGGESYVKEKIGDVSQFAEPGDTIYSIARQNNISPDEIMRLNGFNKNTKLTVGQEVKLPKEVNGTRVDSKTTITKPAAKKPATPVTPAPAATKPGYAGPITGSPLESTLRNIAIQSGLTGQELAQFLAQCAHETGNFSSLTEYGGSLDFRKYDPKYAPKKAKELGNKKPGDGALFKGRGFIQLTGRWNYTEAGRALGLPLDKNPKLVERPDIAAKTSLWFWKNRVRPNVDNFADTKTVTYYINTALRGLDERIQFFQKYLSTMRNVKRESTEVFGIWFPLSESALTTDDEETEDYHPNDRPLGPETKPTMPAGTVKVDVDDVYDWYKLGQHISNMKGLGKHDFGKGPPSTIFSFGSEEEEHKYIKDLERTGLTTTDIDPVDPNQPKGMKRQKTDPTYNVGENFADGKNPQDKGDSARHGIKKGSSIADLKKIRSSDTASARKKQLAHWQINMKQGRKK